MSLASRIEGGGRRMPSRTGRRRYRGEAAEGEERDATPDLFMKYLDATLLTYV
jgi:hypothetical protein